MAQKNAPVTEPLTNIDDHVIVKPVIEPYRKMREDQRRLHEELVQLRQTIFAAERDTLDVPLTPSELQRARQRVAHLQQESDEIQAALIESFEALESARTLARGELRDGLREEARQALAEALETVEATRGAETALWELAHRARRLGIALPLGACVDRRVDARIQAIHQAFTRLQD